MSCWPSRLESKTISWPSGDQRGVPVLGAPMDVSWTALDPSGSASQTSVSPERLDPKATRRPSGENSALQSTRVEEMATTGGDEAGAPGAVVSTRQIFESSKYRT